MPDDIDALTQTLSKEHDVIVQFVEALKLEQEHLRSGRTDQLPDLAACKEKLADYLGYLAEQRRKYLDAHGFNTDRKGVEAWLGQHPDALNAADSWSSILDRASEARELQRVNGKLIEIHLQYTAKALEALQGGRLPLDLYGPDGQPKAASNQHINHTA